jgi:hypothetical protein
MRTNDGAVYEAVGVTVFAMPMVVVVRMAVSGTRVLDRL